MPEIAQYTHPSYRREQEPDTRPGWYFVSATDGIRHGFLLGPFEDDHQRALDLVQTAKAEAERVDPKAVFYGFGTCRIPKDVDPPTGKLNYLLEESGECNDHPQ